MNLSESFINKFLQLIHSARSVLIVGHYNPDGDCIGALTGLSAYLESFAKVALLVPNPYPENLAFLDPQRSIIIARNAPGKVAEVVAGADLIICADFNALSRTEGLGDTIHRSTAKKILIDHHPSPELFADLTLSETEVSSTSEIVYWLLSEVVAQEGGGLSDRVLSSLYAGMLTDTNNFENSLFPSTLMMAAQILGAGIDCRAIQFALMNIYSEERMRLMGEMLLNNMTVYPQYGAAIMILDSETKRKFNFKEGDSEGFVNLPLKIKGVEISALFAESENFIRVSLRSRSSFSVNDFARKYFNGGGHEMASGGRLYIPMDEVKRYFEESIAEYTKSNT